MGCMLDSFLALNYLQRNLASFWVVLRLFFRALAVLVLAGCNREKSIRTHVRVCEKQVVQDDNMIGESKQAKNGAESDASQPS